MARENKEIKKPEIDALDKSMQEEYKPKDKAVPSEIPEEVKKEMEKTRAKLESFKKSIIKKYPFTLSIGIIPPQAAEKFDEEGNRTFQRLKEEYTKKFLN